MANPNALTYNAYVTQVATLGVYQTTTQGTVVVGVDAFFNALIPQMLNYAELRIQKDLDFLPALGSSSNYAMTAGSNVLAMPVNDFQVVQTVSYTSGTASIPLLPTTKEFLQNVYNDSAAANQGPPQYFAVYGGDATDGNTSNILLFGPYPDQNYPVTITGTRWLPSLYATATTTGQGTTYISTNYPDLLIQASMIYLSQAQRNFGPASNDPAMPGSFENQYQTLLKSAVELENRKKFRDAAWSSQSQSPVATPDR